MADIIKEVVKTIIEDGKKDVLKQTPLVQFVQNVNYILDVMAQVDDSTIQVYESSRGDLVGYRPQAVFDAIVLAGGHVSTEVINADIKTLTKAYQAWVMVGVSLFVPDMDTPIQLIQYGSATNMAPGDALKAATTDAVQKAVSLVGIATKAYWGLLSREKGGHTPKPTPQKPHKDDDGEIRPPRYTEDIINSQNAPTEKQMKYFGNLVKDIINDTYLSEVIKTPSGGTFSKKWLAEAREAYKAGQRTYPDTENPDLVFTKEGISVLIDYLAKAKEQALKDYKEQVDDLADVFDLEEAND